METLLPLAEQVATLLKQRRETVAVAESSSGAAEAAITLETGSADRIANMRAFALAGLELIKRHLSR